MIPVWTSSWKSAALALAFLGVVGNEALAHGACKPRWPLPLISVKGQGPCGFDAATATFAGTAAEQAACLLRPVRTLGHLGKPLDPLPAAIADRVGRAAGLPTREALLTHLSRLDLDAIAANLWQPVSRGNDGSPDASPARYLMLHDTSGPSFGPRPFPSDIDTDRKINSLARFRCTDGFEAAHIIINRKGDIFVGHDFAVPWRATKFERAVEFGRTLKGLFLHVEMIQPRRRDPRFRGRNDAMAPTPGFTQAQYEKLALVYVTASVRAEAWLIPTYHAVIDSGIRNGHDDPQNFELEIFAGEVDKLVELLRRPGEPLIAVGDEPPVEPMMAALAAAAADLPCTVCAETAVMLVATLEDGARELGLAVVGQGREWGAEVLATLASLVVRPSQEPAVATADNLVPVDDGPTDTGPDLDR